MKRRGSALLIVLGMLSFVVVSAASFAIFMRQSRRPSSYLRRSASSRYMLKAALAGAIARLDGQFATTAQIGNLNLGISTDEGFPEGIYDDPYPGLGESTANDSDADHIRNGDYWNHRVFTPFGPVSAEETVSTLTLEGLAYLPPAIINEARVFSRQTRTAMWRTMSYDMGRYAFSAFDVSDCFDINKVLAGERRFSAPNKRVTLASLYPTNGKELDAILGGVDSSRPFISIADFNLFAGKTGFTPFYSTIETKDDVNDYIRGKELYVSNALFITDTWFPPTNRVNAAADSLIDLSAGVANQPFESYGVRDFTELDSGTKLFIPLMENLGGVGLTCLYDYLDRDQIPLSFAMPTVEAAPMVCGLGLAFTAPPIPAIDPTSVTVKVPYQFTDPTKPDYTIKRERTISPYVFKGFSGRPNIELSGVVTLPFKHLNKDNERYQNYKVEAVAAVFFAADKLGCRLTYDKSSIPLKPTKADWTLGSSSIVREGVIWLKGTPQLQPSFVENVSTTEQAVKQFVVEFSLPDNLNLPLFTQVTETEEIYKGTSQVQSKQRPLPKDGMTLDGAMEGASGAFMVYDADGRATWWNGLLKGYKGKVEQGAPALASLGSSTYGSDDTSQTWVDLSASPEFRPYVAVWVRVVNDAGKTVDMVPATFADDNDWLDGCTHNPGFIIEFAAVCGDTKKPKEVVVPLLDFRGEPAFKYTADGLKPFVDKQAISFPGWASLYAVDPRYNFAPEDWFGNVSDDASPQKWMNLVGANGGGEVFGKEGRDPDIFMATSDQEQLQSIGELAFLPNVQELAQTGVDIVSCEFNKKAERYHGRNDFNARGPSGLTAFANGDYMWRTYTALDHGDGYDPIYELRHGGTTLDVVSGRSDFRANPFSPDSRVMASVVNSTPYDYAVACDGDLNVTAGDDASQPETWAFCPNGIPGARLPDDDMQRIATALRERFSHWARRGDFAYNRSSPRFSWETALAGDNCSGVLRKYEDAGGALHDFLWYDGAVGDEQKTIFGISEPLDAPLHGVDRKYLHAFWRECFQNRQQLFLVFLRAEPMPVGGTDKSAIASAQLGVRGVALVWRDPMPPYRNTTNARPSRDDLTSVDSWRDMFSEFGPHRTRVLFYHQFD